MNPPKVSTIPYRHPTLDEWVLKMKKLHPRCWIEFQCGIDRYKDGNDRPYDNYTGRMNISKTLYQLGWDMARREDIIK